MLTIVVISNFSDYHVMCITANIISSRFISKSFRSTSQFHAFNYMKIKSSG